MKRKLVATFSFTFLVALSISCKRDTECHGSCVCRRSIGKCYKRSIYTRNRLVCSKCLYHSDCPAASLCITFRTGASVCEQCRDEALEEAIEYCSSPSVSLSLSASPDESFVLSSSPEPTPNPRNSSVYQETTNSTLPQLPSAVENDANSEISPARIAGNIIGRVLALVCAILIVFSAWRYNRTSE